MHISLVVAASTNNAIGKKGQLLWNLPNDTKFFKNITWAMPIAMGRKTFESLGSKPLSGRLNIVVTRQQGFTANGITVVNNIDKAVSFAERHDYKELMVIGGGEIYKAAIQIADKIYITKVHANFDDADAFFPEINPDHWKLVSSRDFFKDEKHAYDYSFQLWIKKDVTLNG